MVPRDDSKPWSDRPLDADDPDTLGRDQFTASVVSRIDATVQGTPSVVFGLVGPWGSGKTSLLNKIRSQLSGDWEVADFTPWSASGPGAIGIEFARVIYRIYGAPARGERKRQFARYAKLAAPMLAAIPVVGGGLSGSAQKTLEQLATEDPWQQQFESAAKMIEADGRRVLVIVDDVDRLGSDELFALLKVMRLLGRFNNVHYLIAYDQTTVEELLADGRLTGRSANFMEKIVQFPFEVPPLSEAYAIRILQETLRQLVTVLGIRLSKADNDRATDLLEILAGQARTPRALARFEQQVIAFAEHVVEAEIDPLDYLAVTWLRTEFHSLWLELPAWQFELNSGNEWHLDERPKPMSAQDWRSRIAPLVGEGQASRVTTVLSFLVGHLSSNGFSSFVEHERAFATSDYFMRYFLLFLPPGDISDRLVEEALNALLRADSTAASVLQFADRCDGPEAAGATLAFSKAFQYRSSPDVATTSRQLLEFVSERLAARSGNEIAFGSPLATLNRWISLEVGHALDQQIVSPADLVALFGEEGSFLYLLQMARLPQFHDNARQLASGFAEYWKEQIKQDLERILAFPGQLGGVVDLITWSLGEQPALLDPYIDDLETYLRVAESFVQIQQWVGRDVNWSLQFRLDQFHSATSPALRDRFRAELVPILDPSSYQIDDLDSPDVSPTVRRDFAIRALLEDIRA